MDSSRFSIKPFWRSRTFWVNVLAVGAIIVGTATGIDVNVTDSGVDPEVVAIALATVNVVLRFFTVGPVSIK